MTSLSSGKTTKTCSKQCAEGVQMADKKPLWEVMLAACLQAADDCPDQVNACYAAEIRALADHVLPERQEPPISPHMGNFAANAIWRERMGIRALLLAEAERAERAG
jgi:hypothetical protein